MVSLGNIFGLVSGGLTFLQGSGTKSAAKKNAELKNKLVEQRNYYNQKELKRVYDEALGHSFVAYATQRNDMISSFQKEKDKAISFMGNAENVDIAVSSVSSDLLNEMDTQFETNLNNNIYQMMNYNRSLAEEKNVTSYQLANKMYAEQAKIEEAKLDAIQRGNAQMLNGLLQMGSIGLNIYNDNKSYKGTDENTENYKLPERPESQRYETDYFSNRFNQRFNATNRNNSHENYVQGVSNTFDRITELLRSVK